MYENSALVIRRASSFDVDVFFGNRAFDADRDDLTVCLSLGELMNLPSFHFAGF